MFPNPIGVIFPFLFPKPSIGPPIPPQFHVFGAHFWAQMLGSILEILEPFFPKVGKSGFPEAWEAHTDVRGKK